MALCVTINADGTLSATGESVSECTGYVMVSSSEYAVYSTLQAALAMPTTDDALSWFGGTFSLVLVFFVVARIGVKVAAMFDGH